ncbi:TerC family protein [Propionicicella superfundia]|uniref:TerC family protein n=1 Tax=Propionicicella superfundia TaxID=348582 RepID=UPI00040BE3BF|nr:TerC family protein [Propionicicella superfundia]
MDTPAWVWAVTVVVIVGLLLFDYFFHVRVAHTPTLREAGFWSAIYVGIAVVFGIVVWVAGGHDMGLEYFAGYLTEKALSVDNLFVFLIIMSSFKVPRADQQKVLLFGIVFSLIARTGFILLGAALINSFAWMFYIFGAILLITAGNLLKPEDPADEDEANNFVIRLAKRFLHTADQYDGDKMFTIVDGRRALTPMLLVMIAIGGTDLMFALDSIPAIFGLTTNVFIVFTATAFSLMGLRQLYFLIDGLLDRLVYLKYGLAAILAFIGVKLVLHALHENNVPFINNGDPVHVVEVETWFSLLFIVATLTITIVWSLVSKRGKAKTVVKNARRHAVEYMQLDYEADPAIRERNYAALQREISALKALPSEFQGLIRDEPGLVSLLTEAAQVHDEYRRERDLDTLEGDGG